MSLKDEVLAANIEFHTALSDRYKDTEPHYKPENMERVRGILDALKKKTGGDSLLDIGCGAGFIIDLAKERFRMIRGVDATQAMLDKIEVSHPSCDIKVEVGRAEKLPFPDNSFGVCSAYAVLHHLHDIEPVFREAHRVLKPGGIFYTDLDPNYYFWEAFNALPEDGGYSDIVLRELRAVRQKAEDLEAEFGVNRDVIEKAENIKHIQGGFKEERLREILTAAGFSGIEIKYEWFLGEGKVIHTPETAGHTDAIRDYLENILPLSKSLFKYVSVYATK